MIEFPRKRAVSIATLFIGGLFIFVGAVALANAPIAANVFFCVLGGLLALFGGLRTIARGPRFRATADHVWFGGGQPIPWSDVKQVFASGLEVRNRQTSGISFELHRRSTLLKTPIEHLLTTPFAVGDIDISPHGADSPSTLASRLEAMRVLASERR